ncbi:TetR/AcrR family transcriptional regulator [Aeromicrobium endophyticum]|uniref:TetR/AcrR family transcriptional regulator n=1 Tax=Aeromicrobium endophyticum TaxID=2292704 RepID=A0A371P389_9ACTN|nr:TetR/AcrR family transcriptional regulator [Aeromicrobium endophyticum]REK69846.1 TetR/AcrR family transcriptional regulator [Aeromicrobium endophyticum]
MPEPETQPAVRRRSATRERLLEATREVLAREGIQGASVEHICEQAGFTRGAFYSNFSSKDDLLLALYHRERDRMFDSMRAATVPDGYLGRAPVEAIGVIIERFLSLQSVDRVGLLVHLEFAIRGVRGDEVGQEFNASWRELKDELVSLMTLIVTELGREFTIDPRHAATVLAGTYDEALREAVTEGHEIDAELLHATLPMLLLAATRPLEASARA